MSMQLEGDFQSVVEVDAVDTRFLQGSQIELVGDLPMREKPQQVLFDFDGTLSLIREGWPGVMIPMMVEVLKEAGTEESDEALHGVCESFVMELNGKQTIYQMIRLAEEVTKRGGTPRDPLDYKHEYHTRLMERIEARRAALRAGGDAEEWRVPGALELLELLHTRGVELFLASGTDEEYVKEEAVLLGVDKFFGPRIFGAKDDPRDFSKAMIIDSILSENGIDGRALVGFGDGYVEVQNVRAVGGLAVAVASDEAGRSGQPDTWKRRRLISAGAHAVIPDFREAERLVDWLFDPQFD